MTEQFVYQPQSFDYWIKELAQEDKEKNTDENLVHK